MDSRFVPLCVAVALLASQVHGFPSSSESKEEDGKAPRSPTVEADVDGGPQDSVTSKRSPDLDKLPDQLGDQKVSIKLPAATDSTKMNVRFPEDSKHVMSLTEEGENVRSKKSPQQDMMYHSPHTTTVCIQVRSDHRPEVVCGPQVSEQDGKAAQTPMARYAYPPPQSAYSPAQGYYEPARQRPIYGSPIPLQPSIYGPASSNPFIMRSPQEQPQYPSPTPMRASGPIPKQFTAQMGVGMGMAPAQAQGSPQQKFIQEMPAQMAPKSVPSAGRGPVAPVYFRTADDEPNSIKPVEEKYQPAPAHGTSQNNPNLVIHKVVQPVPYIPPGYYPAPVTPVTPVTMSPSYRFNCALQPDGLHSYYGAPNMLRSAAAPGAGQGYFQSTPSTFGNPLDVLFGRAADSQKPYGDASYNYYDIDGRQAQYADQMLGSSAPYANWLNSLYGDEASAYAMSGRSASSDVQQQWEQDQYLRMLGSTAGGMSFDELSERAAQQQGELYRSKVKLQQMQQQLKDIEQRAASAADKDKDPKKTDALKDLTANSPEIAAQKPEPKPVPAKKRRSNNA